MSHSQHIHFFMRNPIFRSKMSNFQIQEGKHKRLYLRKVYLLTSFLLVLDCFITLADHCFFSVLSQLSWFFLQYCMETTPDFWSEFWEQDFFRQFFFDFWGVFWSFSGDVFEGFSYSFGGFREGFLEFFFKIVFFFSDFFSQLVFFLYNIVAISQFFLVLLLT